MTPPLISVLMTAYNREDYIGEAIESVLASSYTHLELIVVDDCSKDGTVEIAREYAAKDSRIRVFVNEKNLGDYPNRNRAASLAKGEYIKYVDSDDVMFTSCLKKMISPMLQYPEAGYGICSEIDANTKICTSPRETYLEQFSGLGHFDRSPGGAIIKKTAFDHMGGFSGIRQIGDFEFWLRIGCYYPMVKVPFQIYWVRDHQNQESKMNNNREKDKMKLEVLRKVFAGETVPLDEKEKERALQFYNHTFLTRVTSRISRFMKPTNSHG
jgi:glycosyltransferase involved in cell wall biosynthesis